MAREACCAWHTSGAAWSRPGSFCDWSCGLAAKDVMNPEAQAGPTLHPVICGPPGTGTAVDTAQVSGPSAGLEARFKAGLVVEERLHASVEDEPTWLAVALEVPT